MNNIGFEPKQEFQSIKKSDKLQRRKKVEEFKVKLKIQYIEMTKILIFIENETLENPDITYEELMSKITFSENISNENMKLIIDGVKAYFKDRKESIQKYEKYKDNTKLMIKELFGKDVKRIVGKVNLQVYGGCLVVNFSNLVYFMLITNSLCIDSGKFHVKDNVIVYRDALLKKYGEATLRHEYQHYINKKFLKRVEQNEELLALGSVTRENYHFLYKRKISLLEKIYLTKIKDELIARTKGGSSDLTTMTDVLTKSSDYLDNDFKDLQVSYGIKIQTYIRMFKKHYPEIYYYLTLISSDSHLKLFVDDNFGVEKKVIETKLKLGNILLSPTTKYIVYSIGFLQFIHSLYMILSNSN